MFSPNFPELSESTTLPKRDFLGGKIMSLELNLDPGPCNGNTLQRFLVPREGSCRGYAAYVSFLLLEPSRRSTPQPRGEGRPQQHKTGEIIIGRHVSLVR